MENEVKLNIDAKKFGEGFVDGVVSYFIIPLVVIFVIQIVVPFLVGPDDTDKSTWVRSGVSLKTDYKTGVQYLSDGHGGMVVRVDKEGKPYSSVK